MKQDPCGRLEAAFGRLEALTQQALELPLERREVFDEILKQASLAVQELQQDYEERLALQDRLERERRRYQGLFEFAPDGYSVLGTVKPVWEDGVG